MCRTQQTKGGRTKTLCNSEFANLGAYLAAPLPYGLRHCRVGECPTRRTVAAMATPSHDRYATRRQPYPTLTMWFPFLSNVDLDPFHLMYPAIIGTFILREYFVPFLHYPNVISKSPLKPHQYIIVWNSTLASFVCFIKLFVYDLYDSRVFFY